MAEKGVSLTPIVIATSIGLVLKSVETLARSVRLVRGGKYHCVWCLVLVAFIADLGIGRRCGTKEVTATGDYKDSTLPAVSNDSASPKILTPKEFAVGRPITLDLQRQWLESTRTAEH